MGSKARHADDILRAIRADLGGNFLDTSYYNWVEPFVGGANMIASVSSILFPLRIGNDINPFVIAMFNQIKKGWTPPDNVTEEEYKGLMMDSKIQNFPEEHMAMIGFAGIGCSYSGKWFGGYARGNTKDGKPRNYAKESKNNLMKQKPYIQGVIFMSGNYEDMDIPPRSIIYCDPPYDNTTQYSNPFAGGKFWDWCNEMWERGHRVYVSEYNAPEGWLAIWEKQVNSSLTKETGSKKATEKLFTRC